jgi:hypothetical protein
MSSESAGAEIKTLRIGGTDGPGLYELQARKRNHITQ